MTNGTTTKVKSRTFGKTPQEIASERRNREISKMIARLVVASRIEGGEIGDTEERELYSEQLDEELKWVHTGERGLERDLAAVSSGSRQELSSLCAQMETALTIHTQGTEDRSGEINKLRGLIGHVEGRMNAKTGEIRRGRATIEEERANVPSDVSISKETSLRGPNLIENINSALNMRVPRSTQVTTTDTEVIRKPTAVSVTGKRIDDSVRDAMESAKSMSKRVTGEVKGPSGEAGSLEHQLKIAKDGGNTQSAAALEDSTLKEPKLKLTGSAVEKESSDKSDVSKTSESKMEHSYGSQSYDHTASIQHAKGLVDFMRVNSDTEDVKQLYAYIQQVHKEYGPMGEEMLLAAAFAIADVEGINMQTESLMISPMVKEDIIQSCKIISDLRGDGIDASPLQVVDAAKAIIDSEEFPVEHFHEAMMLYELEIKQFLGSPVEGAGDVRKAA